jgi:hypothetical protein
MLFNFFNLYPTIHCNIAKSLQYTKLSKNGQYRSLSSLLVSYSKDRKEPIKICKPQVPIHFSPWFITGYTDAEGCFDFSISNSKTINTGFSVKPRFRLTAHARDIQLLYMIKEYFNCGNISKIDVKDCLEFTVSDQNSIFNIIIPFFTNYPLRGTKHLDYLDWLKGLEIIKNKGHLSLEGLNKIKYIKANSNTGRLFNNNINLYCDPNTPGYIPLDPNYISGFLTGDGYLSLVTKIDSPSFGRMRIGLTQHQDNYLLLQSIKDYFNVDNFIISKTNNKAISLNCGSEGTVFNILLPFFEKYPIYGVKAITLTKLLKIQDLILSLRGTRKTTKWTPELKSQVISIWEDDSIQLKGDATVLHYQLKADASI